MYRRRTSVLSGIGLIGYVIGPPVVWLLGLELSHSGRSATIAGATVALLCTAIMILAPSTQTKTGLWVLNAILVFGALPVGLLAWANGAPGLDWLWTALIMLSAGVVFGRLYSYLESN
ncbi:MAG TPA: hypothetical protein VLF67_01680 [Candidatus Saccharimonas sp.]|nr:hypothetical protein [Candidatus Saccharimonas sp.]